MSVLKELVKEANSLNEKMHTAIVEVLKQHGGLIRTDNTEREIEKMPLCDIIYTVSMDGDYVPNTEKEVLAVSLDKEEQVCVLPDLSGYETIGGLTDQEVLDCDNWEVINGGYTMKNATLYNICEALEQYV